MERAAPGVIVVRYATAADMNPEMQAPVVERLAAEGLAGPTAVVFVVGPEVRIVDVGVPAFWLKATADARLRLAALAVASPGLAVRAAVAGFGAANGLRGASFAVKGFEAEAAAVKWAADIVRRNTPAPA
jgi:hypothetical protein